MLFHFINEESKVQNDKRTYPSSHSNWWIMNKIQKLFKIPSVSLTELIASIVFNTFCVIAFLTFCYKIIIIELTQAHYFKISAFYTSVTLSGSLLLKVGLFY